jgi:cytochrome P450
MSSLDHMHLAMEPLAAVAAVATGSEWGSATLGLLHFPMQTLLLLTLLGLLVLAWKRLSGPRIPGPWSLPLLGDLQWLGTRPHEGLVRLRRHYGDVFRIRIGTLPVVVVSGLATVKRALVDQAEAFAGRPELFTFQFTSEGKTMCFNSYSATWKLHRRLAERALKMVAGGTTFMDSIVRREAETLSKELLAHGGAPVDPMEQLLWAVAHVKYSLCYGDSRDAGEDFAKLINKTLKLIGCHNNGNLINFFPWTRHLMRRHFSQLKDICHSMLSLTARKEKEHLDTYQSGQVRDALDALIALGVETKCPLEQERVLHTVQEYIGAGLDIVYCSLAWALLYLAQFPEIQRRLQEELDGVVEPGCTPRMEHREKLPYWQAFILETLRHSSVIPFALPHSTMEDVTLNGIHIPKDTFILVSLFSISRDPGLWEDPDAFRPERFLSSDGQSVDASLAERYIPFGVGKRRCVGEQFSRNEIFLFLSTIVHRCHVLKPGNVEDLDLRPEFGVIFRPKQFHVSFVSRDNVRPCNHKAHCTCTHS